MTLLHEWQSPLELMCPSCPWLVLCARLVEQGTHDELMALAEQKGVGEYASLVKMQTMATSAGAASGPAASK